MSASREVDNFTALLAMVDFIDNDMPGIDSLSELKTALVIWRKTHGWGKLTEAIGTTELVKRAGVDERNVRRSRKFAKSITVEPQFATTKNGKQVQERTVYGWPINDRVRAVLNATRTGTNLELEGRATTPPPGRAETPPPGRAETPVPPGAETPPLNQYLESDTESSLNRSEERTSDSSAPPRKSGEAAPNEGLALIPENQKTPEPEKAGRKRWSSLDLERCSTYLAQWMNVDPKEVPAHMPIAVLDSGGGAAAQDVLDLLKTLWKRGYHEAGKKRKYAPKKWGWFPAVVKKAFNDRREMLKAAKEAEKNPVNWQTYNWEPLDPEILRMTGVLDDVDVPDIPPLKAQGMMSAAALLGTMKANGAA